MSSRKRAGRTRSSISQGRQLVVVDIENLAGGACTTATSVRSARQALMATGRIGEADHIVIATSHIGLLHVGSNWGGVRYVVRSGRDGADLALLDVLSENVVDRFDRLVVASGDGIFTNVVAEIAADGVDVTVIGSRGHVARSLQMAASRVVYLDAVRGPRAAA